MMTGIFETADRAIFIHDIEDAKPEIHFALARLFVAGSYDPYNPGAYAARQRTYQLYDRCNRIAFYREKVV